MMGRLQVWYKLANDESGKYRWWTVEMNMVGQFEHADSLEEIETKALALVTVKLNEVTDDMEG